MKKYNVIDLFCGCGGFSKGFQEAGFNIALGIDLWEEATQTYKYNHPGTVVINQDITSITPQELLQKSGLAKDDVDVIIGGPPCQGFSISGKRLIDDPRNKLYKSFVEIVGFIKPKMFVMENVPGLLSMGNGAIKDQIVADFQNIGYIVKQKQLIACDYGVPQARKRVFFVGINSEIRSTVPSYEFPLPTHGEGEGLKPFVTCKEALSDLDFIPDDEMLPEKIKYQLMPDSDYQREMRKHSADLYNHVITVHTKKTREIIHMVPDGGNYKSLPEALWSTRKVHIAWTRMCSYKPCFTIDTGHNHHFHYRADRVPTARESARIQSFSDDFVFLGKKADQLKQIGNAVPPLLAKAVAESVLTVLSKENSDNV